MGLQKIFDQGYALPFLNVESYWIKQVYKGTETILKALTLLAQKQETSQELDPPKKVGFGLGRVADLFNSFLRTFTADPYTKVPRKQTSLANFKLLLTNHIGSQDQLEDNMKDMATMQD